MEEKKKKLSKEVLAHREMMSEYEDKRYRRKLKTGWFSNGWYVVQNQDQVGKQQIVEMVAAMGTRIKSNGLRGVNAKYKGDIRLSHSRKLFPFEIREQMAQLVRQQTKAQHNANMKKETAERLERERLEKEFKPPFRKRKKKGDNNG